ncbi:TetR/AcrR family transcriptional regulator [Bacillota bacterium Meth-B3]|nr:TetR/AcrR family transcriptional regulator [Christensenellaceae bacterium]MEA5064480.1 TetR/AcrR family transcriptional regulator [Eubacteriales bacterium]MEA5070160.1 TetR/AcrR family transcriptional regulator [Christensenellaceae bacterium]
MERLNKRQQQAQETKAAIYEAMNDLVTEKPFERIRIRDICERANISPGAFYHYFSSKSDLLADRYYRTNEQLCALYRGRLSAMHAVDALKLYIEEETHYIRTRIPDILRPYAQAQIENAEKWVRREQEATPVIIQKIVEEGFKRGEFQGGYTPEQVRSFVICQIQGMVYQQCATHGTFLTDDAALGVVLDVLERMRR